VASAGLGDFRRFPRQRAMVSSASRSGFLFARCHAPAVNPRRVSVAYAAGLRALDASWSRLLRSQAAVKSRLGDASLVRAEAAKPLQRLQRLAVALLMQRVAACACGEAEGGPSAKAPLALVWRHAAVDTAACLRPVAGRCRFPRAAALAALAAPCAKLRGHWPHIIHAQSVASRLLASARLVGADTGRRCLAVFFPESGGGWWFGSLITSEICLAAPSGDRTRRAIAKSICTLPRAHVLRADFIRLSPASRVSACGDVARLSAVLNAAGPAVRRYR